MLRGLFARICRSGETSNMTNNGSTDAGRGANCKLGTQPAGLWLECDLVRQAMWKQNKACGALYLVQLVAKDS